VPRARRRHRSGPFARLRRRAWFNAAHPDRARAEYVGQRIATLDDVFSRYAARGAGFYIETKAPESAPGMEEALVDALDRYDLREPAVSEWRVLIQSFSEASLRRIHELDDRLPLVQLLHGRGMTTSGLEQRLARIGTYAVAIGPSWRRVSARLVEAARRHCLEVHPYTVNDPSIMKRLARDGVSGMFTDIADVLLRLRPPAEPRGAAAREAAAALNAACRADRA
jgi:glycerophosphoryl diester phosphodiesterase